MTTTTHFHKPWTNKGGHVKSLPPPLIALARLFADGSPLATGIKRFTAVTLDGRHELDPAVSLPLVVPVDK